MRLVKFVLSVLAISTFASAAVASSHGGAPAGASLWQLLYIELECLVTTSWLVAELVVEGNWFMLANLNGICVTAVNSMFFGNAYVALFVSAVVLLALAPLFMYVLLRALVHVWRLANEPRLQTSFVA